MCFVCVCVGKDDEPDDGPQHYILLLGFYKPQLIGALDALGVHISNVIKLSSEHSQTSEGQQEQQTSEGNEKSQPTSPDLDAGEGPSLFAESRSLFNKNRFYNFLTFYVCAISRGSWW